MAFSVSYKAEDAPCYKCGDRAVGCHLDCNRYAAWKEQYNKTLAQINKRRRADNVYRAHLYRAKIKRTLKGR